MFLETSAMTGEHIEEAFLKCSNTILAKIETGECVCVGEKAEGSRGSIYLFIAVYGVNENAVGSNELEEFNRLSLFCVAYGDGDVSCYFNVFSSFVRIEINAGPVLQLSLLVITVTSRRCSVVMPGVRSCKHAPFSVF